MKRALILGAAGLIAGAVWIAAQVGGAGRPIATLFPGGPVLYLEAKNFQPLLADWNASKDKQLWVASSNYEVFSRSTLFLKLQKAQQEFAAAAGVPPDMALLGNVAGAESGLAIYDIGKLEFLYVTRLPASRVTNSSLWKARGTYQTRKSAGIDYYVKLDKASSRMAAFAASNDYLLLATREDVLANALALLAGEKPQTMASEGWYTQTTQAAKTAGDLRLVLNMPRLLESPYMRSYWIQRNATQLRQYRAAISDLTRAAGSLNESRLLFRATEEAPSWNENAVAQIARLAPANAGLYRAWASPTAEQAFALMQQKILEPQPGSGAESDRAPSAGAVDATVGTEADLETRIDEPPVQNGRRAIPDDLRKLLGASPIDAMLYVGATRMLPDGVFAGIDSAVVLQRASNWDANAARAAMLAAGAELDGPGPVAVSASGPLLILATRPEFAQAVLAGMNKPAGRPSRYAALYQHGRELAAFSKITSLIDTPLRSGDAPMFFSQNVASLGASLLGRLDSASIAVHDTGASVEQSLVYKLKP
jgi:hypothetical protein